MTKCSYVELELRTRKAQRHASHEGIGTNTACLPFRMIYPRLFA